MSIWHMYGPHCKSNRKSLAETFFEVDLDYKQTQLDRARRIVKTKSKETIY